jgi:hypothetical protein
LAQLASLWLHCLSGLEERDFREIHLDPMTCTRARSISEASGLESALRIEQHQEGEGDFRTTLESLISLA